MGGDTLAELAVAIGGVVLAWLVWQLMQFLGTPAHQATATVVRKRYHAGSTRMQGVGVGMHMTSTSSKHTLTLELTDGRQADIEVSAALYEQVGEGDRRVVLYQEGRITSSVRVVHVVSDLDD